MRRILVSGVAVLVLGLAIGACAPAPSPAEEEVAPPTEVPPTPTLEEVPLEEEAPAEEAPAPAPVRGTATIVDFSFGPATVTIQAGGTMVWRHEGAVPHTVTSDEGVFESGTLAGGDQFRFTFDTPGTYTYFCSIHPYMRGTIEVVAPQ